MNKTAIILALFAAGFANVTLAQEAKSIPETAVAAGKFKTLVAAVKAAGLIDTLGGPGPFTVLAPTDEAFAKLPDGTIKELLKPENKEKLIGILKLHVAGGELTSDMAQPGAEFPTLAGTPIEVDVDGDTVMVGGAKVIKADIDCSNGVIHVIDTVILPFTPVEPKALVGNWTYTKVITNGSEKSGERLAGQKVIITEKVWTLEGEGGKFVMDYKIDSKAKPNTIKYTMTESPFGAGMSTGGIVKMVGDDLVVCYSAMGGKAPKEFESKEDSGFHLMHLKKKVEKKDD